MRFITFLVAIIGLVGALNPASAEVLPSKGKKDGRVRTIDYDPMNVIRLVTQFGVSTHVQFPDDETIQDVALGDDQAWKLVPRRNHLFIKPVAERADTNVNVVTTKRTYNFALTVKASNSSADASWSDADLIYTLYFRYPGEERKKKETRKEEKLRKEREAQLQAELEKASAIRNINYFRQGSDLIAPVEAFDDGRFTYLVFAQAQDIPAIYLEDEHGKESLVNVNFQDRSTIVIHRVVSRLILRDGEEVVRVENRSYTSSPTWKETGTTSPTIQRVEQVGG